MKLLVGLGNPGSKYQFTRHNIGFMLIDALAEVAGARSAFREELKALTLKVEIAGSPALLVKPQTYMNLSGESVQPLMSYYKIAMKDLLVIQDDIDQPFGQVRFHIRRGHGGHNGIRSLHQLLGTDDYARLKMGVGRPLDPRHDVADYVLGNFSKAEESGLLEFLRLGSEAVEYFVQQGVEKSANHYNSGKVG